MTSRSNRERFENQASPRSRIGQELEALRRKIADLQNLEFELTKADLALSVAADAGPQTSEQIKSEIKRRLGYFPLFFTPAADFPEVFQSLWQQSLTGYYHNPLPDRFKERLFMLLARYCSAPYSLVTHCCKLHSLGMPAADVLRLLQEPTPSVGEDLSV